MDGILLKNGERKVPYDAWRNAVIREGMKGIVVRAFAELKWKRTLTVLYLDEDRIMRRVMHLEPVEGPLGDAQAGSVWMFSGFLRTGDVMDAGRGVFSGTAQSGSVWCASGAMLCGLTERVKVMLLMLLRKQRQIPQWELSEMQEEILFVSSSWFRMAGSSARGMLGTARKRRFVGHESNLRSTVRW